MLLIVVNVAWLRDRATFLVVTGELRNPKDYGVPRAAGA